MLLINYLKKWAQIKSIDNFRKAEKMLEDARANAKTFLRRKNQKIKKKNYKFMNENRYDDEKLTIRL